LASAGGRKPLGAVVLAALGIAPGGAALKNATVVPPDRHVGRKGMDRSTFRGYASADVHEGMSWTMEGALNDFGIANMAAFRGIHYEMPTVAVRTGDTPPRERARFREMARRRIADDEAPIGDLVQGLGWEGRALLALLENADPERVPDLIATLPQALRDEIEALDPARRGLGDLEARLILIHGRSDSIIPYSESVALARAAPPGRARLYLVEGLDHVEAPAGLADEPRLARRDGSQDHPLDAALEPGLDDSELADAAAQLNRKIGRRGSPRPRER